MYSAMPMTKPIAVSTWVGLRGRVRTGVRVRVRVRAGVRVGVRVRG